MFFGEYSHQIDDKKRMRIPSKFKQELGKDYVFCKGVDGVINVFPMAVMEAQAKEYEKLSAFDEEAQTALMNLMASIFTASEDKQGRVQIPDELIDFAKIDKDIVTIGMGNRLSVMSKLTREKNKTNMTHAQNMVTLTKKMKETAAGK